MHALTHIRFRATSNLLPFAAFVKNLTMWTICCHSDCVSQIGCQIVSNTRAKLWDHTLERCKVMYGTPEYTLWKSWPQSLVSPLMLCDLINFTPGFKGSPELDDRVDVWDPQPNKVRQTCSTIGMATLWKLMKWYLWCCYQGQHNQNFKFMYIFITLLRSWET